MGMIMINGVSYGGSDVSHIELTFEEYKELEANGTVDSNTVYFITDDSLTGNYADSIIYNNSQSQLNAKNVQSAIDALDDNKINRVNPVGTGSFSMNRKADTTIGNYSTAEGYDCEAVGDYSHAEGWECASYGEASHSEGVDNITNARFCHVEGASNIASSDYQHVQGKCNIEDTTNTYAHIVGNGVPNARSNAHTLDWDGNAEFAGDVIAYGCGGENPIKLSDLSDEPKDYYVSPEGNDETGDGTETNPWLSIQKAVDACGRFSFDRIHIAEGSYFPTSRITISQKRIEFILYGEYVMLYDTDFTSNSYMIQVNDHAILRIYSADLNAKTSFYIYSESNKLTGGIISTHYSDIRIAELGAIDITITNSNSMYGLYAYMNSSMYVTGVDDLTIYNRIGVALQINSNMQILATLSLRNNNPDTSVASYGAYCTSNSRLYIRNLYVCYSNASTAVSGELLHYDFKIGLYAVSGSSIYYMTEAENGAISPYDAGSGGRIYTGSEDLVNKITHKTSGRYLTLIKSGDYYYLRPDTQNDDMILGSTNYPLRSIFTNRLNVLSERITCKPSYENTTTYAQNVYVGTSGVFSRSTNTSSKTIKHDIKELENEELLANNLYDLNVYQFKYNDDIITDETDARYGKDLVGFIIEEMDEKYPIAIDKPSDNVKEWSWNAQYLIPPMLKLIQDQKKQIDDLEKRISNLEK